MVPTTLMFMIHAYTRLVLESCAIHKWPSLDYLIRTTTSANGYVDPVVRNTCSSRTHVSMHLNVCAGRPIFYCNYRFALIKSQYAHCFHLPDKWGRVTYYERPGMSDFAEMRKVGITKADLLNHYIYCMEYLWQVCTTFQHVRSSAGAARVGGVSGRCSFVGSVSGLISDSDFCSACWLPTAVWSTCGVEHDHLKTRSWLVVFVSISCFFVLCICIGRCSSQGKASALRSSSTWQG